MRDGVLVCEMDLNLIQQIKDKWCLQVRTLWHLHGLGIHVHGIEYGQMHRAKYWRGSFRLCTDLQSTIIIGSWSA